MLFGPEDGGLDRPEFQIQYSGDFLLFELFDCEQNKTGFHAPRKFLNGGFKLYRLTGYRIQGLDIGLKTVNMKAVFFQVIVTIIDQDPV